MQQQQKNILRPVTVDLIGRIIQPLTDSGLVTCSEYSVVVSNLKYLAKHGVLKPAIMPKLISPQEAAEMLGISYSQFRALEAEGAFPFKRKLVGSKTVRYRNTDIISYIENTDYTDGEG